jgi:gluconokinase/shikimate kinase
MVTAAPRVLVLMGVTGSGKSTVATLLAERLGWDVEDGDNLHPPANIAKMAAGHPLDDDDRMPWLENVAAWIHRHTEAGRPGVIACSALTRRYRDVLRGEHVTFVYLAGTRDQIADRLAARHGHFMPPSLLDSQFAILEPPGPDENATTVDISAGSAEVVTRLVDRLQLQPLPGNPGST